jgi:type IV pilus assembly protein PilO
VAFETGLEGRPWYVGAIIGVIVAGVFAGLGYQFQLKPMWDRRDSQVATLGQLQNQIAAGEAAQARLPQFREEVARLEIELEKLLLILPPERDVPDVLRRFRALAEQGDFVLNRFAPREEVEKDFYKEWPIQVEVQGSYHNLARFFDRMSRFSRIFNVDNMTIRAQPQEQHSLAASFVAKTFVYKESEAATDDAGAAGGGAGGRP